MQINRASAALKRSLRPSRIARSISAILVLTFIQTMALPIIEVGISKASASTLYDKRTSFLQWDTWRSAANHIPYWNESTSEITSNSSAVQFTQNVNSQTGFAWNTETVSMSRDFTMSANYYFGQVDGADGIVFFMRPLSTWPNGGTAGASTGSWSHWSSNEVRVYFDTYANGTEIAQDHIRISAIKDWSETAYSGNGVKFKNGSGTIIDDVETNQTFPITLKWTASSRTIEVFSGLNANYLITSAVIPATDLSLTEYNWGWMGFTGGANNYQYVTDVNYQVGPDVSTTSSDTTVEDGTSVTLNASYLSSESSPTTRWEYSTDGGGTWTTTGVSTTSYTFTATRSLTQRKYRFYVESTAVGTTFSRATNPITLRVTPPILRSETDTALTTTGAKYATIANSTPIIPGTVSTMTIEAWLRPSTTCDGAAACTVISVNNSYLIQVVSGKVSYKIGSGSAFCDGGVAKSPTTATIPSGQWSHISLVRVDANVKLYINGQLRSNANSSCVPTTQAANSNAFFIGVKAANSEPFVGSIDEVRMWNTDRSSNAVSDMHSNETSTSGLLNYWNFNEGTGTVAYNGVPGALASTDLTITDATTWDASVISVETVTSTYTTKTFYRSYITASGTWKAPSTIPAFSALVVAGGGGGGWNSGGGGGGGGFLWLGRVENTGRYSITVGAGGRGSLSTDAGQTPTLPPLVGQSSQFGSSTVAGGNPGGVFVVTTAGGASITTGSGSSGAGGAGAATSGATAGAGGAGTSFNISGSATIYSSGGGGGGYGSAGGLGGSGAGDGGGVSITTGTDALANRGGGGGASSAHVFSGNGGSGVVILRWITPLTPSYTKPVNAYLNVGMTETFTTNVMQDSATVGLTRTFKWESTTPTANGTYTLIKQGTGAANAVFSWVPSDTTTSGSGYLYRLTVTDSDTAGLFITDSSTAYAVINRALNVSGQATIPKAINVSKSETFTITLGTSTYRTTMTSNNPGITLDTSTAASPVIKISETMTVGIYYETLTVIDSVSASIITPLTIVVSAPPNLINAGEIVNNNLLLNLDAGNSASSIGVNGAPISGSSLKDISGLQKNGRTGGVFEGQNCAAPTFVSDNGGALTFDGTSQCLYIPYLGTNLEKSLTVESWVKIPSTGFVTGSSVFTQNDTSTNYSDMSFNLGALGSTNTNMRFGFRPGAGTENWRYSDVVSLTPDTWMHLVGTYDGTNIKMYINGTLSSTNPYSAGLTGSTYSNTSGYFIGVGFTTNKYFKGSIASVRVYKTPLTQTEVSQNYNSTKSRFLLANSDLLSPTQKYGNKTTETFTVTSGYGTDVLTYSTGTRSGLRFDTSGAVTNLQLLESLTVGTYYETITVTDSLGQSTYLPLSMTVTKADTITVSMGTSVTTVYNGSAPAGAPKASITGLVGIDTATVATGYYSLSCAQGGICKVGDVGPGGGTVFYVSSSPINTADGVSSGGLYLEIAPKNWNGNGSGEAPSSFATNLASVSGTSTNIGTGAENTRLWRAALGDSATAATLAMNRTFNGVSDWFVPSYGELTTAITTLQPLGKGSFESYANLWSSTQNATDSTRANNAWSANPPTLNSLLKTDNYYLRPIRAFSPTVGETSTPVDVETYTAMGNNLSFQIGAASNYQAVVYETSTLKITQANQNKLSINLYGAVAGLPFTIQVTGGSGSGAITETITAGSTATNCQVVNHVLSNSNAAGDQKTCNIRVTKAASRNYFEESTTATVYFMAFVDNQPRSQVGSGSTIGLNGINQIWAEPGTAPTISTFTASGARGSTITINGSGFNTPTLIVEFYFYQVASTVNLVSPTQLTVVVPAGATTGPIVVTNSYSSAFSGTDFTVG